MAKRRKQSPKNQHEQSGSVHRNKYAQFSKAKLEEGTGDDESLLLPKVDFHGYTSHVADVEQMYEELFSLFIRERRERVAQVLVITGRGNHSRVDRNGKNTVVVRDAVEKLLVDFEKSYVRDYQLISSGGAFLVNLRPGGKR